MQWFGGYFQFFQIYFYETSMKGFRPASKFWPFRFYHLSLLFLADQTKTQKFHDLSILKVSSKPTWYFHTSSTSSLCNIKGSSWSSYYGVLRSEEILLIFSSFSKTEFQSQWHGCLACVDSVSHVRIIHKYVLYDFQSCKLWLTS